MARRRTEEQETSRTSRRKGDKRVKDGVGNGRVEDRERKKKRKTKDTGGNRTRGGKTEEETGTRGKKTFEEMQEESKRKK